MPRPFRLIAGLRNVVDRATLVEHARTTESLGCSHLCIHDHLEPQLAPIPCSLPPRWRPTAPALPARVQQRSAPPRRPGPGAGDPRHHERRPPGRRHRRGLERADTARPACRSTRPAGIERLTEAIAILRGLFADGPFSFAGRHYTITALDGQPKPVQRPHPPFLIGGTSERVLRLAAREADIVGLDLRQDGESLPMRCRDARTSGSAGSATRPASDSIGSTSASCASWAIAVTPSPRRSATRRRCYRRRPVLRSTATTSSSRPSR